jgi:hypothetical protein
MHGCIIRSESFETLASGEDRREEQKCQSNLFECQRMRDSSFFEIEAWHFEGASTINSKGFDRYQLFSSVSHLIGIVPIETLKLQSGRGQLIQGQLTAENSPPIRWGDDDSLTFECSAISLITAILKSRILSSSSWRISA